MPRPKKFLAARALGSSALCALGILAALPGISLFLWACCRGGDVREGR